MPPLSKIGTLSLITLIIQNATVALITRQSRLGITNEKDRYHTSTVILLNEVVKMILCLIFFWFERKCTSISHYWQQLSTAVFQQETWKLSVPAALFTLQNFLQFVSLANLDVMTFQMLSQTKLLSAAIFSVWLLNRRLNTTQWLSLVILTLGVILAHVKSDYKIMSSSSSSSKMQSTTTTTTTPVPSTASDGVVNFSLLGVVSCIISGLSSSFAGVYFEKVVKTSAPSLAVRNIHLSLFGIPFAILSMLVLDVARDGIQNFEFLRGYTAIVWWLVIVNAIGGLLVAAVVKYADNILKGFATAVATVLSGVYAAFAWHYFPTMEFVIGCIAVFGSVMLFHYAEGKPSSSTSGGTSSSSTSISSTTPLNKENSTSSATALLLSASLPHNRSEEEIINESEGEIQPLSITTTAADSHHHHPQQHNNNTSTTNTTNVSSSLMNLFRPHSHNRKDSSLPPKSIQIGK